MRWFRFGLGGRQVQQDPGQQAALSAEVRQRFGAHVRTPFHQQADAVAQLLGSDDGLVVAAGVFQEFANAALTDLLTQCANLQRRTGRRFVVDRRNYRPLWREAGQALQWPLFALPGGLHPYVQVAGAVAAVGSQASRLERVTTPEPVLSHVFEILDLTIDGWEHGRVPVDVDAATLADRLIWCAAAIRAAMPDPPPLPPPVREQMRRNNTIDVYDPAANRVVSGINPGAEMRQTLLV
jgi:hypothetical protein